MKKTNALRLLDLEEISYETLEYDSNAEVDGVQIAALNDLPPQKVFKTLVAEGKDKNYFVFVIPVSEELDLKKAARVTDEKKMEMLPVKKLTALTGYVRGGCSPVGMKKEFPTWIHKSAEAYEEIYVSAGKKGLQMRISPQDLARVAKADFADLTKEGN
ncbi:Cys-tRNA(Pro)/Cys-tRNA(Cys) deacylase ybaK [Aedoeadaptatus ivorii]|uniref:Cys-tRNA(Pro)/Cys-tRNA(Cys) deacylase n=1 Tax=Aedoeadaptatus ivorii TaxID=54006 RepID=A0A3S5BWC0_9FIRM|nr:Cys-tRNA(Pro) deacylase [Peptoniphilus ivorii]VEJ35806.1 Cys-tRNA(Pro)/Cys-tRNA(Cys) deacylase ybaK [Peptoniphilus ivorii]